MTSDAKTPEQYIDALPPDRKEAMMLIRSAIIKNLPTGFAEVMSSGMIGYVVPHQKYPAGYHCDPKQPLPYVCLASQKNYIAFYHMGLYVMPALLQWFEKEYPNHAKSKLDMGKSCIRFKKLHDLPVNLIGELISKVSAEEYIQVYEKNLRAAKA